LKVRLREHLLSLTAVSVVLIILMGIFHGDSEDSRVDLPAPVRELVNMPLADYNDPFIQELLGEALEFYFPERSETNETIMLGLITYHQNRFRESVQTAHLKTSLSLSKFFSILWMFLKFLIVYVMVMGLTYYGVLTLGTLRFILKRRRDEMLILGQKLPPAWKTLPLKIIKTGAYLFLFCPAYVIAYSFRTEFNTDTLLFMVLLGVLSNGVLVLYANKFFTFLNSESRKGYVDTARVKNLKAGWTVDPKTGIPFERIFSFRKKFPGHIFDCIFQNARLQYLTALKEQAGFLITGLIIIEMALNIHGHLNYEMLTQILYKNYDIVLLIVLAIFYTVKFTEIFTDVFLYRERLKYENR